MWPVSDYAKWWGIKEQSVRRVMFNYERDD